MTLSVEDLENKAEKNLEKRARRKIEKLESRGSLRLQWQEFWEKEREKSSLSTSSERVFQNWSMCISTSQGPLSS